MKRIQSIERAILILEELSVSDTPLSLSYLSEKLSLKKSTLHGILNTLSYLGYVNNQHHLYTIGTGFFGFHPYLDAYYERIKIKFLNHLDTVPQMTSDLVLLSIPCGWNEYIYIEGFNQNNSLNKKDFIGRKEKLNATPTGKVIRAFCNKYDIKNSRKLNLDIFQEINNIKKEGYATDIFEQYSDICHISVPLYDKGEFIAAISLVGLKEQLRKRPLLQHLNILKGTSSLYVR
ncbi:TPA: helix-turn-helix domain-containing protein [Vibrio vulnificus]|nr:helix-turn-helix domain-containing protein [Vibrio vulnificus]HDY7688329.1 helix-turn-helix domain-containing protein [Vibrio vulnificus]